MLFLTLLKRKAQAHGVPHEGNAVGVILMIKSEVIVANLLLACLNERDAFDLRSVFRRDPHSD